MEITVCVGSSCHLKGSYDIIQVFKEKLEEAGLADQILLKASFCMGHCTDGVAVKINDRFVDGVSAANASQIFEQYVLGRKTD